MNKEAESRPDLPPGPWNMLSLPLVFEGRGYYCVTDAAGKIRVMFPKATEFGNWDEQQRAVAVLLVRAEALEWAAQLAEKALNNCPYHRDVASRRYEHEEALGALREALGKE